MAILKGYAAVRAICLSLLVAAAGGLLACGGPAAKSSTSTASSPAPTPAAVVPVAGIGASVITIHAVDFSFKLDKQKVPAGPVHLVLINDSKDYSHEVWVYPQQQPRLQEMLSLKEAGQPAAETDYLQGLAGEVKDVAPGQTASFDATLTPGVYELACFITSTIANERMNHYSMGMHTLLTVTAP